MSRLPAISRLVPALVSALLVTTAAGVWSGEANAGGDPLTVTPDSGAPGEFVSIAGEDCEGVNLVVVVAVEDDPGSPFIATPDGAGLWSLEYLIPEDATPGDRVVDAVCRALRGPLFDYDPGSLTVEASIIHNLTSTGVGTALQSVSVVVPDGGTLELLDSGGNPVDSPHNAYSGQGTYFLDGLTSAINFQPEYGIAGEVIPSDRYLVKDFFGEPFATGTYTPSVTAPAGPTPQALTSSGPPNVAQTATVAVPPRSENSGVTLLDSTMHRVTSVGVDGGVYTMNRTTGVITFTPDADYVGTPTPVTYQVTDGYGSQATNTYSPSLFVPEATTTTTMPVETTTTTMPATTLPAVTTTVPAATTTVPSGAGSVQGFVWFDVNRDGNRDLLEPLMPGVPVQLTFSDSMTVGLRRPQAEAPSSRSTVTGADGSYTFTGLRPGSYVVKAAVSLPGFAPSSDTDGTADWSVAVAVSEGGPSVASFAGVGEGSVSGTVSEAVTGKVIASAAVQCRWAGVDGVAGTSDDVTFTATADASGRFSVTGIPFGDLVCSGVDPATNRQSSAFSANVVSAAPVVVPLSVTPAPAGGLPATGSESSTSIKIALAILAMGATTTVIARRRRPA